MMLLPRLPLGVLGVLRRCASDKAATSFDLIVIGGGSGGLACSKAAAALGAKVALIDAVEPTPIGTVWGIGGTCANVGCIPKKLMHQAALLGRDVRDSSKYGWRGVADPAAVQNDWPSLVQVVNERIKAGNWVYRVQLKQKNVQYFNAFASFIDRNTVQVVGADKKKITQQLSAPRVVLATGLRPRYPNIPGAELGITSDDIFSLHSIPGRTVVLGGGYVALETAGLLASLGQSIQLLVRSSPLKTFDQDCVVQVMHSLRNVGVGIQTRANIIEVRDEGNGKKKVVIKSEIDGSVREEVFDTIIWAIGREPRLANMGMDKAGVDLAAASGRILANDSDETTAEGVYAIGDVAQGRPELTPSAILCGRLLAERLFGGSTKLMDYNKIATTVFTPLELGTVGLTEEHAIQSYGEDNLEIFHSFFSPFEFTVPQNDEGKLCYAKVVCHRRDPRTILGIHIVGPNAAEIMQGFAVALKKDITYDDLVETVGIHPCSAESLVQLSVTKRSGLDPKVVGCCG